MSRSWVTFTSAEVPRDFQYNPASWKYSAQSTICFKEIPSTLNKSKPPLCQFLTYYRQRTGSPLWHKALERYREELEENDDYEDVIEIGSLEDLLNDSRTIESLLPRDRAAFISINRLGPKLQLVDDFSAVIAVYFGADAKLMAFVWGSIRLILTLASSAGDTLQDVLDMLEELSLTLPRFKNYEKTLPMDRAFETALIDVYTEVICFYARVIHFFRAHPHNLLRRGAWEDFRGDFGRTVRRIKRMSSTIEKEADLARLRIDDVKYKEVLDLMESLKKTKVRDDEDAVRCYHVPSTLNPRFWGRKQAFTAIKEALDPERSNGSLKAFALYGMGGAGKTQIALQYANSSRDTYSAILWVSAESTISMGQSFRGIAQGLGIVKSDDEIQDAVAAILKVKNWLTETRKFYVQPLKAVKVSTVHGIVSVESTFADRSRLPLATCIGQCGRPRDPPFGMAWKRSRLNTAHDARLQYSSRPSSR